jgi:tRNA(Ile)-lysidine synthase
VRRQRPLDPASGEPVLLVRPLLGWRRDELRAIVEAAALQAVDDPANSDPRHDRTHARNLLASASWLDAARLAASAANLADSEEALSFAAARLYDERRRDTGEVVELDTSGLPRELKRRLLLLALQQLGAPPPRGPELMRLIATAEAGGTATLAGVKLEGGTVWGLSPAPPRNR